jgi:hypothetical protein
MGKEGWWWLTLNSTVQGIGFLLDMVPRDCFKVNILESFITWLFLKQFDFADRALKIWQCLGSLRSITFRGGFGCHGL